MEKRIEGENYSLVRLCIFPVIYSKGECMYLRIPSVLPRGKPDDTVQASPVIASFLLRPQDTA